MKILYVVLPGTFFYLFLWSPVWGTLLFVVLAVLGSWLYLKVMQRLQLIRAAKRIEPLFVVSRNPKTGLAVQLPDHLDELCAHVPYKKVAQVVGAHRKLLRDSGNPLASADTPEGRRLPVVAIIFRDGRNVNEEWDEFDERAVATIKQVRADWHEMVQAANSQWYWKHHHRQEIEWDV